MPSLRFGSFCVFALVQSTVHETVLELSGGDRGRSAHETFHFALGQHCCHVSSRSLFGGLDGLRKSQFSF